MNNLQVFNFHENEVRMIIINDEPWFCLKDVCDILGLSNPSQVKNNLETRGGNY